MIPSRIIKNGKISEERQKAIVRSIVKIADGSDKKKEMFCYDFYEGNYSESNFRYLTEITEDDPDSGRYGLKYQYPAKMRFINMIKPKLESLNSPLILQPDSFKIIAVDQNTIKKKLNKRIKTVIDELDNKISTVLMELKIMRDQMMSKNQELQQFLQKEPESQEEAQQQQQMRQLLPIINNQMDMAADMIDAKLRFTDDEKEKISMYNKKNAVDIAEIYMQKGLQFFFDKNTFKYEEVRAFRDKKITGKELYFVDLEEGQKWPTFERLSILDCDYSADESEQWVQDCSWVRIKRKMSAGQILDEFKDELDTKVISKLQQQCMGGSYNEGNFVPVGNGGALDLGYSGMLGNDFYGGTMSETMYDVSFVYYKVQTDVQIKYSPNKNSPGDMFRHFITGDELEEWIKKENKNRTKGEDVKTLKGLNHIYEGILIGNNTFVRLGMKKWQLRDENLRVKLPVIGYSYNKSEDRPNSIVWNAKDIQILLNIVHYHEELMLAIAGTKTMILDHNQKPPGMTIKEWLYQLKMGMLHIDSNPRGKRATFNQFNGVDNSVSQSIQYLDNIKKSLNADLSYITGVPREAEGQTVPTDQVGTYQMAIQQGNMRNLILFFEHEEVFRAALVQFVNLLSISWDEGAYINYTDTELGHYPLEIPEGTFDDIIYDVIPVNRAKMLNDIEEIKSLAMNYAKNNSMPFDKLLQVYNTKNIDELIMKYESFYEKAQKIAAKQQESNQQSQLEAAKEIESLKKEYDKIINEQKMKIEEAKIMMDNKELDLEKQRMEIETKLKSIELQIKAMDVNSERSIEKEMTTENVRSNKTNEMLNLINMMLNLITTKDTNDSKHKEIMAKLKVEKQKLSGNKKNHINNN
jgi:hypothetical protein